ncbi:hypothetical protein [Romboutsia sp. 1001216sp1]|uniref:hypothetical protein n=1 Tax=Romboutsia sp. 1001216sp1 TaxID=2986997 RepID=UPI00232D8E58|nr:hypothetical protein [Romboutsia sp. 1001216sp1]MDB8805028.1 hypothetical protein [Romboutsia sp. 1001216sp1]MDB8808018.1 hypothetical protein [Romboutsia sp. 1001216sp1]MDB8810673.1 hypothetical protein [Romboutsia sp. 1001216sp1]MDB8816393.1 hypothetical protein [Romboutsia sp. 1001216sp1]MDB8818654.1 hypothetical protein [Romboutsia sp. 1001216sp1]
MERPNLEQLNEKLLGRDYFADIDPNNKCWKLDVFYKRMYDIYYIFAQANIYLSRAADRNLNIEDWSLDDDSIKNTVRIYERGNYLKSCILAFNSIEDYINQILPFTLNLTLIKRGKHGISYINCAEIKSNDEYIEKSGQINSKLVRHAINDSNLLECINNYKKDLKEIRDYANKIKHKHDIRFKEFPNPEYIGYTKRKPGTNIITDSSEWTMIQSEGIEDIIDKCYAVHPKIKNYVEKIYNHISEKYGLEKI